ncbi:MAG: AmmeMemoRadiSam system radical SAM enzyme [Candidatus Omnitrophica bacterium]|nr:AmmeMemoRadiSam system radical SAM enzyme [Candidatus Omnitrophota bacterium]
MKTRAILCHQRGDRTVQCVLCAHRCRIVEDAFGFCGVRQNIGGTLFTHVYGYPIALQDDPIEKKPLYHFLPGSRSFSIATVGCNFQCGFCQNWQISQTNTRGGHTAASRKILPEEVVNLARERGCQNIAYTYTEPTVFFEYARDIGVLARRAGLKNLFVTNGYLTGEARDELVPFLDAANVDLKSFRDEYYREICRGRLEPVLETIRDLHRRGIWVEVTTLIVPGENDSDGELGDIASFLVSVSPDIPWHISAFHPDYRFTVHKRTPAEKILRAQEIGHERGLRFIYPGNISGSADTRCPVCGRRVIRRSGFTAEAVALARGGVCGQCGARLNGVWEE